MNDDELAVDSGARPAGRTRLEAFTGSLLGGAVGDALGAAIEFLPWGDIRRLYGDGGLRDLAPAHGRLGAITDDTQMTLFTAEGLIRADNRRRQEGIWEPVTAVYRAYLRWLDTQGMLPAELGVALEPSWLSRLPDLRAQRAPGNTSLVALRGGAMGTVGRPINGSKGCGGVMRVAPVGLAGAPPGVDDADRSASVFRLGCELAAITHGHPSGYLSAGCLASIIAAIVEGAGVEAAVATAMEELRKWPDHQECLAALQAALALAAKGRPSPTAVETLGGGWVGEEALAIAVACALTAESFEDGVLLAVNHGGDSDSTGAIAGTILGVLLGVGAIPIRWLAALELRDEIEDVAVDLFRHLGGVTVLDGEDGADLEKYPAF